MTTTTTTVTREQWLETAVGVVAAVHPEIEFPPVKVSCSWPGGGSARTRIGECWPRRASAAEINEIFISPKIDDAAKVVSVLMHELAHAIDDCKSGHGAEFTAIARSMGMVGKPTQMEPTAEVAKLVSAAVIAEVGAFPHSKLDKSIRKKQSTRMIKCSCAECGALWRLSQKVYDMVDGDMSCPACHVQGSVKIG